MLLYPAFHAQDQLQQVPTTIPCLLAPLVSRGGRAERRATICHRGAEGRRAVPCFLFRTADVISPAPMHSQSCMGPSWWRWMMIKKQQETDIMEYVPA